ncbi:MAG: hypothetical protein QGG48_06125 [Desulfatiglandales bacterium]|nr:hypothetical protein [Desulfatiglandales bacterium]
MHFPVKDGKVKDILSGGQYSEKVRNILSNYENADNIEALGIGISHIVPFPIYGTRRDGARIGTAHVALGRNNDIGGETLSDVHMDALMDKVTVELDGNRVLNNGVLLI